MKRWLAAVVLLAAGTTAGTIAAAQGQGSAGPNGVFLIAKPDLLDPNFSKTVL